MDDAADGTVAPRANRRGDSNRDPKVKYMEILQDVADRKVSEICIELDDLDIVSLIQIISIFVTE